MAKGTIRAAAFYLHLKRERAPERKLKRDATKSENIFALPQNCRLSAAAGRRGRGEERGSETSRIASARFIIDASPVVNRSLVDYAYTSAFVLSSRESARVERVKRARAPKGEGVAEWEAGAGVKGWRTKGTRARGPAAEEEEGVVVVVVERKSCPSP